MEALVGCQVGQELSHKQASKQASISKQASKRAMGCGERDDADAVGEQATAVRGRKEEPERADRAVGR